MEKKLLKYGTDSLEYSNLSVIPSYCIDVLYVDKFDNSHKEQKCGTGWVDDLLKRKSSQKVEEESIPSINLDAIVPRDIHLAYLRSTYGTRLKEEMRKKAIEIIKLDTSIHSGDEGLTPVYRHK
ncbi:hypothetical protein Q0M94_14470 [Deinococcus radiomollis]|uniref:hypothetical protein n=1 Tax=Deinococcus radiomollis TaxID=468916 RepID=UPI0038923A7C